MKPELPSLRALRLVPLLLALLTSPAFAAKPDPRAHTEALVQAFLELVPPPKDGALDAAARARNAATFARLDGFFDRERITGEPVAPHRDRFRPEELARFQKLFWETVRLVAYPDSGAFFREARWSLGAAKVEGDRADVPLQVRLEAEDLTTEVTFHWRARGETWLLADVSFDGASLVKDYQNQFGRILGKEGVAGLLERLAARHAEASKARAGLQ